MNQLLNQFKTIGHKNLVFIFLSISLILTSFLSLVVYFSSGSLRYEISIYDSIDPLYWGLFFISYIFIILCLLYISYNHVLDTKCYLLSFLTFYVAYINIISMPYIKGYFFWGRGDALAHRGYIQDILSSGSISDNFYPLSHILTSILAEVSNININLSIEIMLLLFSSIFILFIYLISLTIFNKKYLYHSPLFFVIFCVMIDPSSFSTGQMTYYFFPLIFFALLKVLQNMSNSAFIVILAICIICLPFYHPVDSAILFLSIILLLICTYVSKKYHIEKDHSNEHLFNNIINKNFSLIPIIYFVVLFVWFTLFSIFRRGLYRTVFGIIDIESSKLSGQVDVVANYSLELKDLISIVMAKYGDFLILVMVTAFLLSYCIYLLVIKKDRDVYIVSFSVIASVFLILELLTALGKTPIDYMRFMTYCTIPLSIFIGIMLTVVSFKNERRQILKFLIFLFIFLFIITAQYYAFFNFFPSPISYKPNIQVPYDEYQRMAWLMKNRNENLIIDDVNSGQYHLAIGVVGYLSPKPNIRHQGSVDTFPPDHFLYNANSDNAIPRYLLTNKLSYDYYKSVGIQSKLFKRFEESDVIFLKGNPLFNELYSNGDSHIYTVYWS